MKRKIRYTDEPVEMEVVEDFLPPPDRILLKEDTVKVTLNLSRRSVEFFKKHARSKKVPYQRMIKKVLDLYVHKYD